MDATTAKPQPTLRMIPLGQIQPDPKQPRKHYDAQELTDLACSIAEHGVLQPILVRTLIVDGSAAESLHPLDDPSPPLMIIAGERRWRASQQAGLAEIPAIVADHLSDDEIAVIQLIENLQRADLSTRETVTACANLVERLGLPVAAEKLGKSKAWVSRRSGVVDLPNEVQKLMTDGTVDSIDVLHDLAALFWLTRERFDRLRSDYEDPEIDNPTREDVRRALKWAQEAKKRDEERAAREQQSHQEALGSRDSDDEDDPAPRAPSTSSLPATSAANDEMRWQAQQEAQEKLREYEEALDRRVRHTFGLPIEPEEFDPDFDETLTLYVTQRVPAKPPAEQGFYLEFAGAAAQVAHAAEILSDGALGRLRVDVSPTEALQIEKLLGRPVQFHAEVEMQGALIEQRLKVYEASKKPKADKKKAAGKKAEPADPSSVVSTFLARCTDDDQHSEIKAADLHAAYVAFCKREGHTPLAINSNAWGDLLAKAGLKKHRLKTGWHYRGIALWEANA